ncbi:MAG: hypothetical protein WBG19_06020 [Thermoplasmata archaeon]
MTSDKLEASWTVHAGGSPPRSPKRPSLILIAIAVAIALGGAYFLTDGFHLSSSEGPSVLVPKSTLYSLPGEQFIAVAFTTQKAATLSGMIANTQGINLYQMTPHEVVSLSITGNIEGYTWTSGRIANLTTTNIALPIQPGQWDLVFLNTAHVSLLNDTVVTFYSDLTLTPA